MSRFLVPFILILIRHHFFHEILKESLYQYIGLTFYIRFIAAFYVNPFHRAFAYKAVPHCVWSVGIYFTYLILLLGIKIPHFPIP